VKPPSCTAELLSFSNTPPASCLRVLCCGRSIIILVKAGAPVDATIKVLEEHLEPGDCIIDGGNEW